MPDPFQTDSRRVTVKEKQEVFSRPYAIVNKEFPRVEQLFQQSVEHHHMKKEKFESTEEEDDEIRYLSGKPFFDVVLGKSHVKPLYLFKLPVKIARELPRDTVPVVLTYSRRNWNLSYIGNCRNPRFDPGWRKFVSDNDLDKGDACVFEVMECSHTIIKFKVHILRGKLPPELQAAVNSHGTADNPIEVD